MNKFNFSEVLSKLKNTDISLDLANTAKNDFLDNFRQQGFGTSKWKEVKRRQDGTKAFKYPKTKDLGRRTRAILQGKGSGRLRKDVANSVSTGHRNNNMSYSLVVDNEYAGYHNEGSGNLPKRQFVGTTERLNKKLLQKISSRLNNIWKT